MTRHDAARWIKVIHVALVAVLLAGPAWMIVSALAALLPDASCEERGCSDGWTGLGVSILLTVLIAWLVLVLGQLRLAIGPETADRYALLAGLDLVWITGTAVALGQPASDGEDVIRTVAATVLALSIVGAMTCLAGMVLPRERRSRFRRGETGQSR